ncbi:MAG: hypothetical protein GTO55_04440 [Armatimonadetes bacterium]|nr:hypothetical protein [Armatimonadota bacterium]NIO75437.1 hypothetical protein [Armatimonadota bacterium]
MRLSMLCGKTISKAACKNGCLIPAGSSNLMPAIIPAILLIAVLTFYLGRFAPAWRAAAVVFSACLLDQGAKALVMRQEAASHHFFEYSLGALLQIHYEENHALGFGGSPSSLLLTTAICVSSLLILYPQLARRGYRMSTLTELGCALMVGGLLGILLDRIRLGFVVDFMEFGKNGNFTYNLADLCVFAALVLLVVAAIRFLIKRQRGALSSKQTISPLPANWKRLLWVPALVITMAVSLGFVWRFGGDKLFFLPPLHKAAYHGEIAAVRRLLAKGADPNGLDSEYGQTPLHWAVGAGNTAVARILLTNGADPNVVSSEYPMTPLDIALVRGHVRATQLLLTHGASISESSLYFAVRSRDPSVVQLLLDRGADLNRAYGSKTPLMQAASWGRSPEIMRLLLAAGAEVNARGGYGKTALHYAVASNRTDSVRLLLEAGAEVNARDNEGKTPLDAMTGLATSLGGESLNEKAALLVTYGADVNSLPKDGRTPLIRAVLRRDTKLVKTLLDAGAKVNQAASGGRTALHYASAKGLTDVVRLLLAAGAAVNAKDDSGATPLDLAKDKEIAELLR